MSYLSQLDSVLNQIDQLLNLSTQEISQNQSNQIQPQINVKDSKQQIEEKKEEILSKLTKKAAKNPNQSNEIDEVTGWYIDSETKLPIDPDTNKSISKKQYKRLKKLNEKKKKDFIKEQEAKKLLEEKQKKAFENCIEIKEDSKLEKPTKLLISDIFNNSNKKEFEEKYVDSKKRIEVRGWVHFFRKQKSIIFMDIRDGTGCPPRLQCVLSGNLILTKDAMLLAREATIMLRGTLVRKEVKGNDFRPYEFIADYYEIIGHSSSEIENIINKDSNVQVLLDQRHWLIRSEKMSLMLRMRCYVIQAFREYFFKSKWIEITPPTMVQTQVEGGSTLFKLNYFEEDAYLTQSSQLYLETCCPSLGNVFCIMPSYRAERAHTRRHLSEYTHVEGELPFISFEDLLNTLEDMLVGVCNIIISKHGNLLSYIHELNGKPKDFKFIAPKKPFVRMTHEQAIDYCNANGIKRVLFDDNEIPLKDENGNDMEVEFKYGDDISEKPERAMTDKINKPILLIKFPAKIKSFYMSRDLSSNPPRPDLTESVDVLIPGVGEIIGGSMREINYDKLMNGFKEHGINPDNYYWYTDLRKYGTHPHGGFGLGLERFLCWLLDIHHIRDSTLYPRFCGRCKP